VNVLQLARQAQYLLQVATWPDSANELVFGNVLVTEDASERALMTCRPPYALIGIRDEEDDPDAPGFKKQRLEVGVFVQVPGDETGQNAILGANRASGSGSSLGRGLLEVEEIVESVLKFKDQQSAVKFRLAKKSAAIGRFKPELGSLAARSYTVEAFCTSSRTYEPVLRPTGTALGGGQIRLDWTPPPARFDFTATTPDGDTTSAGIAVMRKAGGVPPASLTDGTLVTTKVPTAATHTDTPGAGTWSYSLIPLYDEFLDSTALRQAAYGTLAGKVVT
jgi:hypothetical protein